MELANPLTPSIAVSTPALDATNSILTLADTYPDADDEVIVDDEESTPTLHQPPIDIDTYHMDEHSTGSTIDVNPTLKAEEDEKLTELDIKYSEETEAHEEACRKNLVVIPDEEWKRRIAAATTPMEAEKESRLWKKHLQYIKKLTVPKKGGKKKKYKAVYHFHKRHSDGVRNMSNHVSRLSNNAATKVYYERMLELEKKFKSEIEQDPLLRPLISVEHMSPNFVTRMDPPK